MEGVSPDAARGFSIWIEPESLHYHARGVVRARALWGRMMRRDGRAALEGWRAYALDPRGEELEADIARGDENCHQVAFFAGGEGLYSLVLENEAGIYCRLPGGEWAPRIPDRPPGVEECVRFFQRARVPIPVGHHVRGRQEFVSPAGLDVFSEEFREYHPGEGAVIRVYYAGRPLAGAEVKATYHFYTGTGYPWRGVTGEDGGVPFTFTEKGHWMFTCTLDDGEAGGNGLFDRTLHTASLVLAGVR